MASAKRKTTHPESQPAYDAQASYRDSYAEHRAVGVMSTTTGTWKAFRPGNRQRLSAPAGLSMPGISEIESTNLPRLRASQSVQNEGPYRFSGMIPRARLEHASGPPEGKIERPVERSPAQRAVRDRGRPRRRPRSLWLAGRPVATFTHIPDVDQDVIISWPGTGTMAGGLRGEFSLGRAAVDPGIVYCQQLVACRVARPGVARGPGHHVGVNSGTAAGRCAVPPAVNPAAHAPGGSKHRIEDIGRGDCYVRGVGRAGANALVGHAGRPGHRPAPRLRPLAVKGAGVVHQLGVSHSGHRPGSGAGPARPARGTTGRRGWK